MADGHVPSLDHMHAAARQIERAARDRKEALRIKDNLLHWCKEADRQLNAIDHPDRVQESFRADVAQPEEQLSPEQFQAETVEPLLVLRDCLNGTTPLRLFDQKMPKQSAIRDMAAKLLEHGRDPEWFKKEEIQEILASLDFLASRTKK